MLFALGDGCSSPPNVVGVQDYGTVTGRVLDAMTNRPIPNALVSVGSLYTSRADAKGAFMLRSVVGDQTVTARAAGYGTATADTTITKDATVSIGYIRLVPLTAPLGQPTLAPPVDSHAGADGHAAGCDQPACFRNARHDGHAPCRPSGEPLALLRASLIGGFAADLLADLPQVERVAGDDQVDAVGVLGQALNHSAHRIAG